VCAVCVCVCVRPSAVKYAKFLTKLLNRPSNNNNKQQEPQQQQQQS